jgi:hypothetical protein
MNEFKTESSIPVGIVDEHIENPLNHFRSDLCTISRKLVPRRNYVRFALWQ